MRFGFMMYPGYEELDLIGPWEIATMWRAYAGGPECLTVAETRGEIRCGKGLLTRADTTYADVGQLDYLLIPGGNATFEELKKPRSVRFVKEQAAGAKAVMSVCTGTFLLHAAGLLDGRRATTNWKYVDRLRGLGVSVVEERYVHDGPIWSSAGIAAGIDMLLAFIAHVAGPEAAWTTQYQSEYIPEGKMYGSIKTWANAPAYAKAQLS